MKTPRFTHTYNFDRGDYCHCYLIGPNPVDDREVVIAQRNRGGTLRFTTADKNFVNEIQYKKKTHP